MNTHNRCSVPASRPLGTITGASRRKAGEVLLHSVDETVPHEVNHMERDPSAFKFHASAVSLPGPLVLASER